MNSKHEKLNYLVKQICKINKKFNYKKFNIVDYYSDIKEYPTDTLYYLTQEDVYVPPLGPVVKKPAGIYYVNSSGIVEIIYTGADIAEDDDNSLNYVKNKNRVIHFYGASDSGNTITKTIIQSDNDSFLYGLSTGEGDAKLIFTPDSYYYDGFGVNVVNKDIETVYIENSDGNIVDLTSDGSIVSIFELKPLGKITVMVDGHDILIV